MAFKTSIVFSLCLFYTVYSKLEPENTDNEILKEQQTPDTSSGFVLQLQNKVRIEQSFLDNNISISLFYVIGAVLWPTHIQKHTHNQKESGFAFVACCFIFREMYRFFFCEALVEIHDTYF